MQQSQILTAAYESYPYCWTATPVLYVVKLDVKVCNRATEMY